MSVISILKQPLVLDFKYVSVVLYEYETLYLTVREEQIEDVWGQGAEENTWTYEEGSDGKLEKLHNEKLHNLYCSQNITRMIKSRMTRWAGHVACMGEVRNAYKILARESEGKRPLGGSRCRWEDHTK
jgi:hypothetical protein